MGAYVGILPKSDMVTTCHSTPAGAILRAFSVSARPGSRLLDIVLVHEGGKTVVPGTYTRVHSAPPFHRLVKTGESEMRTTCAKRSGDRGQWKPGTYAHRQVTRTGDSSISGDVPNSALAQR